MSGIRFLLDGRPVAAADAVLGAETGLVRSGEGWFETLRAEQGRWMFEGEHLARMEASVAAAGLDANAALQAARATLQAASIDAARPARLRLLVTPSPAARQAGRRSVSSPTTRRLRFTTARASRYAQLPRSTLAWGC